MLTACFISRALATELPGPGAIYLGQTLKFTAPVYLGEEVEISLEVTGRREERGTLTIATTARKVESGETVIKGEATVMLPREA
jgi:acyl dehydratase